MEGDWGIWVVLGWIGQIDKWRDIECRVEYWKMNNIDWLYRTSIYRQWIKVWRIDIRI